MGKVHKVTLQMSEIIFDIQNKTYLTGRSRSESMTAEQIAAMQANDEEDNLDQIRRSIISAVGVLRTSLGEYLENGSTAGENELPSSGGTVDFDLVMPSNYNSSSLNAVVAAAHDFIVSRSVADWFLITNKADAEEYLTIAKRALSEITNAVNKRRRPQRAGSSGGE